VVVALAVGAVSPAFVRVHAGQRFTMVLTQDLPKHHRKSELDLAVERMEAGLGFVCVGTSVRRIGDHIVFGVSSEEADDNQRLADMMLQCAEPVQLRIAAVDYGVMDVHFLRERLPFWRYWA
jgi:hypothetical protein